MKRFLMVLTLVVFSSVVSKAQNWCPPGAHWKYTYAGFLGGSSTTELYIEKDTTVEGWNCAKVVGSYGLTGPVFTYSSGDTAYMYLDSAFQPLLFFNAQAGDSIQLFNESTSACCSLPRYQNALVDSTGILSVNGLSLKRFYVHDYIIYTERLGFDMSFVHAFYQSQTSMVDGNVYVFCNYGDSTIAGFWLYPDSACDTHVGISVSNTEQFSIYPDPASTIIHVKALSSLDDAVEISDISGRSLPVIRNGNDLDIRSLSPGIYFLSISSNYGQKNLHRFVKE